MTPLQDLKSASLSVSVILTLIVVVSVACARTVEPEPELRSDAVAQVVREMPVEKLKSSDRTYEDSTDQAVVVPVGYQAPKERVANTGAYLPKNGKPTLVFVDSIW